MKMLTIVGIFMFMSRKNSCSAELSMKKKSLITLRPGNAFGLEEETLSSLMLDFHFLSSLWSCYLLSCVFYILLNVMSATATQCYSIVFLLLTLRHSNTSVRNRNCCLNSHLQWNYYAENSKYDQLEKRLPHVATICDITSNCQQHNYHYGTTMTYNQQHNDIMHN